MRRDIDSSLAIFKLTLLLSMDVFIAGGKGEKEEEKLVYEATFENVCEMDCLPNDKWKEFNIQSLPTSDTL